AQVDATVEEQRAKPRRLQRQPTRSFTVAAICTRRVASLAAPAPRSADARMRGGQKCDESAGLTLRRRGWWPQCQEDAYDQRPSGQPKDSSESDVVEHAA